MQVRVKMMMWAAGCGDDMLVVPSTSELWYRIPRRPKRLICWQGGLHSEQLPPRAEQEQEGDVNPQL